MQKDNRLLDDLTRMASGAAGTVLELKREVEAMVSQQLEKLLMRMELVTREEYEATQASLLKSREEQEELKKRLAEIEKKLADIAYPETKNKM